MKKELYTEIEIAAPAAKVWRILTDFEAYPNWNPFIKSISGELEAGATLDVFVQPSGARGMRFRPVVQAVEPEKELRWRGRFLFSGLFDGEHIFRLEKLDDGRVKFVHGEKFDGLLVGLMARRLDRDTLRGFREMNEALKKKAEWAAPEK